MKSVTALTIVLNLAFSISSAGAFSVKTIFAATASGTNGAIETLEVAPGVGLNINLIPTGEVVKKAWIDDPSKIALGFDGDLCVSQHTNQQRECTNSNGATVVHLRQIKLINFPALTRSTSGVTLLTLVAEGATGRKLYQFKVVPTNSEPKYTTVTITPNPPQLEALAPTSHNSLNRTYSSATPTSSLSTTAISDANAAQRGLAVAKRSGRIIFNATMWEKTHRAINLLRRGSSPQEAASLARIPIDVLSQLIIWGRQ